MKLMFFILLCVVSTTSFAYSNELYAFNNPQQQTQFAKLTTELRCLVCQNQNLAESNAPLAADLRTKIANMIKTGSTNTEIINYLVKRYGDYILYKPPVVKATWLLWYGPFALLIFGLSMLFINISRQRK